MKKIIKRRMKRFVTPEDSHGFQYTVRTLVHMHQQNKALSSRFGTILNNDILKHKTSDTIFLLGSGPSINHLGTKEFDIIRQHNSMGFNFWFAHDFIPDLYMMQIPKKNPDPMINIFQDRSPDYMDVPFILRGGGLASGWIDFEDVRLRALQDLEAYFLNEYPISDKCRIDIDLLIEYMNALGFMQHGNICNFVPKWRVTLGLLVSLAYQMGYKNIVLCGMDMQDKGHFWDDPQYSEIRKKYNLPDAEASNITRMSDKTFSPNTVPQYIYKLRDWMNLHSGVNFYVAHPETVLYPEIPLYDFNE